MHPLTSVVLFNNVAELFSALGRSASTVMPWLAARIDSEELAADAPETEPLPESAAASEEILAQPAELPAEEAARESVLPSEVEVEWARIDVVLDVSREN